MSWKDPPSDITVELGADPAFAADQLQLYKEIKNLLLKAEYKDKVSLRTYFLGYERPPNIPGRQSKT